jgi:ribosome-binding protein aMBF1 (putative translation factor)
VTKPVENSCVFEYNCHRHNQEVSVVEKKRYTPLTEQEILKTVGERLRKIRKARELSLVQAAKKAGLGKNTVLRAEHGDNPSLRTMIRLLRAYGELESLERFIRPPELSPLDYMPEDGE